MIPSDEPTADRSMDCGNSGASSVTGDSSVTEFPPESTSRTISARCRSNSSFSSCVMGREVPPPEILGACVTPGPGRVSPACAGPNTRSTAEPLSVIAGLTGNLFAFKESDTSEMSSPSATSKAPSISKYSSVETLPLKASLLDEAIS